MKQSQAIRFSMAAVVLVLLLTGCPHPSPPSSESSSSSSSSTSESTVSPSIEPATGLESPESPTNGGPSLSLPAPPVGNNNHGDGACIQIAWLTGPIPHGDIVTVTSVTVRKPFTFDQNATARCSGGRSCFGYQFSQFNDNNGAFCNVGVGYMGGTIDSDSDDSAPGRMVLAGKLICPHISSATCRNDAAAMQASAKSPIPFDVGVDFPTPPPPSSPPESPPTSPVTSDSSSSTAPSSP
jgi:hypothetical protein